MEVHGSERVTSYGMQSDYSPPLRGLSGTGCLSAATFWIMNHGVAETEEDMDALWTSLVPLASRQASFLPLSLAEVESGVVCCFASARLKNLDRRVGRNFHPVSRG